MYKRQTLTCPKCKGTFPFPDSVIVQIANEPVISMPAPTKKPFDWSLPALTPSMKVLLWILILANAISVFALKEAMTTWPTQFVKLQSCLMVAIIVSAIGFLKGNRWGVVGLCASFVIGMTIAPWFADNLTSGARCFLYYSFVGGVFCRLGNDMEKRRQTPS